MAHKLWCIHFFGQNREWKFRYFFFVITKTFLMHLDLAVFSSPKFYWMYQMCRKHKTGQKFASRLIISSILWPCIYSVRSTHPPVLPLPSISLSAIQLLNILNSLIYFDRISKNLFCLVLLYLIRLSFTLYISSRTISSTNYSTSFEQSHNAWWFLF